MPSAHELLFAESALPELFAQFGEAASYAEPDGDPVSLTAIVGEERTEMRFEHGREHQQRMLSFTICRDPSGDYGGVAEPKTTAQITFGGVVYAVKDIEKQDGLTAVLQCVRVSLGRESAPRFGR